MLIELNDVSIEDVLKEPFIRGAHNLVVIPSNEAGVFGAGIAKIVRNGLPELESLVRYTHAANAHLTSSYCLQTSMTDHQDITIVTMPTKTHWGQKVSALGNITRQLLMLGGWVQDRTYPIIMPKIGCGLGGLDWEKQVRPIVAQVADKFEVTFIVVDGRVDLDAVKPGLGIDRRVLDLACIQPDYTNRQGMFIYHRRLWYHMTPDANAQYEFHKNEAHIESILKQNYGAEEKGERYERYAKDRFITNSQYDRVLNFRNSLDGFHVVRGAFFPNL